MFVDNPDHYSVGRSALHCMRVAMLLESKRFQTFSTYRAGMDAFYATSSLAFPRARLTACEIDTDVVDFCALTFGGATLSIHTKRPKISLLKGTTI